MSEDQFSAIAQLSGDYEYKKVKVKSPFNRQKLVDLTTSDAARVAGYARAMLDLFDTAAHARNAAGEAVLADQLFNLSVAVTVIDGIERRRLDPEKVLDASDKAKEAQKAEDEAWSWRTDWFRKNAALFDRITTDLRDDGRGPELDRRKFVPGSTKVENLDAGVRSSYVTVTLPNSSRRTLHHCVVHVQLVAGSRASGVVEWAMKQAEEPNRVPWKGLSFNRKGNLDIGLEPGVAITLRPEDWSTPRQAIFTVPAWTAGYDLKIPIGSLLDVVLADSGTVCLWSDDGHVVQLPLDIKAIKESIERVARADYEKSHPQPKVNWDPPVIRGPGGSLNPPPKVVHHG